MKRSNKVAGAVIAALGLGLAAAAFADPGQMAGAMGHGAMGAGMGHGPMAGQSLMSSQERSALMEKMRSAKTPEERQKLAETTRAEMQKRAKDKGIQLPEPGAPGADSGAHSH